MTEQNLTPSISGLELGLTSTLRDPKVVLGLLVIMQQVATILQEEQKDKEKLTRSERIMQPVANESLKTTQLSPT